MHVLSKVDICFEKEVCSGFNFLCLLERWRIQYYLLLPTSLGKFPVPKYLRVLKITKYTNFFFTNIFSLTSSLRLILK